MILSKSTAGAEEILPEIAPSESTKAPTMRNPITVVNIYSISNSCSSIVIWRRRSLLRPSLQRDRNAKNYEAHIRDP